MKLNSLLETDGASGATIFFNTTFHYVEEFSGEVGKKDGDIRLTVIFPSVEESKNFILKCRTKVLENFFKEYMEISPDYFVNKITQDGNVATIFNVERITEVEIDGDPAMSNWRTATGRISPFTNTDKSKWAVPFNFNSIEEFVQRLNTFTGKNVIKKHFGSDEIMLDTLTL